MTSKEGSEPMGVAIELLRTAAIVGAGVLTNHQTHQAVDTTHGIVENLKKNATNIFMLLFFRDVLRSLIVIFFISVAAIVATSALNDTALFRAAGYFAIAVLALIGVLTALVYSRVKALGRESAP
jgi:hypothetical protein